MQTARFARSVPCFLHGTSREQGVWEEVLIHLNSFIISEWMSGYENVAHPKLWKWQRNQPSTPYSNETLRSLLLPRSLRSGPLQL